MDRKFRNKLVKSFAKAIDTWTKTDPIFTGANSEDDNSDDIGWIDATMPTRMAELCIIALEMSAENQAAIGA